MVRYIDAEDFAAEVRKISKSPLNEWDTWGVLSALERVPTADVVPVKHASFIFDKTNLRLLCTNCKTEPPSFYTAETVKTFNYCPNCGAKIDEEVE